MSPYRILRPQATSNIVLLCDHSSNHVPVELHGLGLPERELTRHIAWDIGAAAVTEILSEIFDATAILCNTSRLVIDCNRHITAADLIPEVSDQTPVPGNLRLDNSARNSRIDRWYKPYHDAIESVLIGRVSRTTPPIAISIHSMTESLGGIPRPWQIALSSHVDRRLTDPMLAALRKPGDVTVGDNQPYDLDPAFDYSVPAHALRRNLLHLQVEFRQNEIDLPALQRIWAQRFADALSLSL